MIAFDINGAIIKFDEQRDKEQEVISLKEKLEKNFKNTAMKT